jgi:hypothetical protein
MEGIFFAILMAFAGFMAFLYEIKKRPKHMLGWQNGAIFSVLLACQWLTVGFFMLFAPDLSESNRITIVQVALITLFGVPTLLAVLHNIGSRVLHRPTVDSSQESPGNLDQ